MKKSTYLLSALTAFTLTACSNSSSEDPFLRPIEKYDEPFYEISWHFNETNNFFKQEININENSHINIEKAWDITKGSYKVGINKGDSVKIAVIDNNFDIYHEDLKDNVLLSYDFGNDDNDVSPDNNVSSHGTAVASFAISPINNKGTIGAAPQGSLIAIKIDLSNEASIISAFEYARTTGAKVVNCSWGGGGVSQAMQEKIQELYDDGIIIVFAIGNGDEDGNGRNFDDYLPDLDPSQLDTVLAVGASNFSNKKTTWSDYGSHLDVLAPGEEVLGAFVTNNETQTTLTNNYSYTDGTSFSAPIVSGVIALMISVNPTLSFEEARRILIETADKIESSDTIVYEDRLNDGTSSTFNIQRGFGKVNAYKAVLRAQASYTP